MTKVIISTIIPVLLLTVSCTEKKQTQETATITISGQITDFDGNPIDSCIIQLKDRNFNSAYETYSDKTGYYTLKNVETGHYLGMYALREKEYPRENAVPEEDMRLEFWAWNVIADSDLIINPRYQKLEL
ncbi:MAG: carboxypeptidase-like regulatory domain-containing protein, partial [Tannerella sp.]|nr:carboxypeptidase-like regulatory domain-containing protein [Tannerella sp.]